MASSPSPQSKSAVADFDPSVDGPKPVYTRFRLGEGRGGGSCRWGTVVLRSSTPTPDPSPQGGGEHRERRIGCDLPSQMGGEKKRGADVTACSRESALPAPSDSSGRPRRRPAGRRRPAAHSSFPARSPRRTTPDSPPD